MAIRAVTGPLVETLSHRAFSMLWFGQLTSQFAANITLFLLGLLVYKNTGSNTAVSGLFLTYGIPSVLFGMVAGTVVDYVDKRFIILVTSIVRAFLVLGLLLVSENIILVYLLLFLNAVVTQFFVPAEATLIPKIVPAHLLLTANSMFSFAYYSSMAIGFILAGPLLRVCGETNSFIILMILYLITAATTRVLPKTADDRKIFAKLQKNDLLVTAKKVIFRMKEGMTYVMGNHLLFDCVILLTGTQIIFALLGTLGPGFADTVLGIDVTDASFYVIGPVVVGILLGSFWVGSKGEQFSKQKLISIGVIGAGVSLLAVSCTVFLYHANILPQWLSQSNLLLIELFLFFLLGVSNSLLDVPANSILQKNAEGELRGRVYGVLTAFVGGVGVLPVLIGGILADAVGVGNVVLGLGIIILIYGIYRTKQPKIHYL